MPEQSPLEQQIAVARSHTFGDLLRRSALRNPRKTALITTDRRFTYAELDATVNRVASALEARGLTQGSRTAVLSHNSWEYVVLAFALARLGVVLVPINYMLNGTEVAYILENAGVSGVIVEDSLQDVMNDALEVARPVLTVRGWIPLDGRPAPGGFQTVADWEAEGADEPPSVVIGDDDPIRLMYTSGTESRPKGALLSSRSLIAQYVSCIIEGEMAEDDIEVHAMPLYHCAQLDCFLGPDMYVGATSIVVARPDPELLLRTIESEGVTKLFCPPTVWISLLRHPNLDATDLSTLTKGYYGASPMPVEVLKEMQERLPGVRLWNFYGQTEMSPLATILKPHEQTAYAGSAGRPVLNVETRLVDEAGVPVRPGEVGEIVHRSPHATLGYFGNEEKTAEAFAGGWFHSGDLGVQSEDGYITVVDRKKDMIKTGGENVASREVEEAIYELPEVAEVAVFGLPDPRWIEAVTAVVVPKAGASLTAEAVIAHCRGRLAGYKTPKCVHLTDQLPKNPSGKILKRELRLNYSDGG